MTIVASALPANLFLQPMTQSESSPELRQLDLQLDQIVRASVVKGGLEKVILELNRQYFEAGTDKELQVGQSLRLQVLQTQPTLELRVLNDPVVDRLTQTLPLLARPYDWSELVARLQPREPRLAEQLQSLLSPNRQAAAPLKEALAAIVQRLQDPVAVQMSFPPVIIPVTETGLSVPPAATGASLFDPLITALLSKLQSQTDKNALLQAPRQWQARLHMLLTPLQRDRGVLEQLSQEQRQQFSALLKNLQSHPRLTPALEQQLDQLLGEMAGAKPKAFVSASLAVMPEKQQLLPAQGWLGQVRLVLGPLSPGKDDLPQLSPEQRQLVAELFSKIHSLASLPADVVISIEQLKKNLAQPTMKGEITDPGVAGKTFQEGSSVVREWLSQLRLLLSPPTLEKGLGHALPLEQQQQLEALLARLLSRAKPEEARVAATIQAETREPAAAMRLPSSSMAVTTEAVAGMPTTSVLTLPQQINALVKIVESAAGKVSPELLGQVEGLLSRLRALPQTESAALSAGLEAGFERLTQLAAQPGLFPRGEQLGLLAQLFGLYLEAELLQGKTRDALLSLKLSLLKLRQSLPEEVTEPLKRLELFQLCKARLAEENLHFLPLPFAELEEGYLLLKKSPRQEPEGESGPLSLSLSLRLSALGNMRVDMLYDPTGVQLRIAGESREKMAYLENCGDELKQAIETVPVRSLSFAADAELPARQLQKRLAPESQGIVNMRA